MDAVGPVRSTAHSPLFQVSLEFQNTENPALRLPGLTVEGVDPDLAVVKVDLEVILDERFAADGSAAGMVGAIDYATDLFDADTVRGFAERFVRILDTVTAEPGVPVGDIEILGTDEVAALTPGARCARRPNVLLPELLSAAVERDRSADAVSYRGPDDQLPRTRRILQPCAPPDRGRCGPGTTVALSLPRSIESVLSVWAVARTGAAFLPVDPGYPLDRIEHMLTDSGGGVRGDPSGTPRSAARHRELDRSRRRRSRGADPGAVACPPSPMRTGRRRCTNHIPRTSSTRPDPRVSPKGVAVTHRGLANLAAEERDRLAVTPGARVLHFASPSFDASVFELVMAFCAGATLVIAPPTIYGGTELAGLLSDERVSHGFVTPTALASMDPPRLRVAADAGRGR